MTTYQTAEQARDAQIDNLAVSHIIEIDGGRFIGSKVPAQVLAGALKTRPMAEVKSVIGNAINCECGCASVAPAETP